MPQNINKEKVVKDETIILRDNWRDESIDNHFLYYKNLDRINLLEIK